MRPAFVSVVCAAWVCATATVAGATPAQTSFCTLDFADSGAPREILAPDSAPDFHNFVLSDAVVVCMHENGALEIMTASDKAARDALHSQRRVIPSPGAATTLLLVCGAAALYRPTR